MGTYLWQTLKFSGQQIGLAYSTTAMAAMVSPFFVGMVADRFFATETILAALHIVGGAAALLRLHADDFRRASIAVLADLHALLHADAGADQLALVPTTCGSRRRSFPRIRVLGTIGWIVAGLIIGWLGLEASAIPAAASRLPLRSLLGTLLPDAAAHAAAERGQASRGSRRPRARRAVADEGPLVRDLRPRLVPALHPAAVLLRVHQSLPERDRRDRRRRRR